MATLAGVLGKYFVKTIESEQDRSAQEGAVLRPFPNEDIHFYVKRIDNSRVVREADPASRGACWKTFAGVVAAALLAVMVLMPSAYGLLAGYHLEQLRAEERGLLADQATLQVEEASLLTPGYMLKLAKEQHFVDPAPDKVVYLQGNRDAEFAAIPAGEVANQGSNR
jgi:hypothetical protein